MVASEIADLLLAKARAGMTYTAYRALVADAVSQGRTTGTGQTEALAAYTALNQVRMDRLDRTVKLDTELVEALRHQPAQTWLVLSEGWCGDAAQNLPALAAMADSAPAITLVLVLRDEHPDLMDRYLTGTSRSIPKLIAIDADGTERFTWGPRPSVAQAMVLDNNALPLELQLDHDALANKVHAWYAKDRTASLQQEILALLNGVQAVATNAGDRRS